MTELPWDEVDLRQFVVYCDEPYHENGPVDVCTFILLGSFLAGAQGTTDLAGDEPLPHPGNGPPDDRMTRRRVEIDCECGLHVERRLDPGRLEKTVALLVDAGVLRVALSRLDRMMS